MIAEERFNVRGAKELDNVYATAGRIPESGNVCLTFAQSTFGKQLLVRLTTQEARDIVQDLIKAIQGVT